MLIINKRDGKIEVKINNSKRGIKTFIIYEVIMVALLWYFKAFDSWQGYYVFPLLTTGNIIVHVLAAFSYEANEKLEITADEVVLKFYAWRLKIYERALKNDETLNIRYDKEMNGSIKFIFKSSYSIFEPEMYRLLKLEQDGKTRAFGYNLEKRDFDQIEKLILRERNKNK